MPAVAIPVDVERIAKGESAGRLIGEVVIGIEIAAGDDFGGGVIDRRIRIEGLNGGPRLGDGDGVSAIHQRAK